MELKINGLEKSFGEKKVLRGISLTAESGRPFGFLGRNGAGKTTSIRILMGVLLADAGEIALDGQPIDRSGARIGYLPEERGLYPKKEIMEQLIYFGVLKGMGRREARVSAQRLLERLDMGQYVGKNLETLSKGNQQKIQLAATLVADPDIIILDEPFSGLDPVNAVLLKDVIDEMAKAGKLVLLSSHQMNYIEELCPQIAILNGGQIVLSGEVGEIKRGYDRRRMVIDTQESEKVRGAIPWPSEYENGHVTLTLPELADRQELLKCLSDVAGSVDSVRVYEPSLSDIFIQYTEEQV